MDTFTASMLLLFVSSVFAAYQLTMFLLLEAKLMYRSECLSMHLKYLNSPSLIMRKRRVCKPRASCRFWVKPGRIRSWWDNFVPNIAKKTLPSVTRLSKHPFAHSETIHPKSDFRNRFSQQCTSVNCMLNGNFEPHNDNFGNVFLNSVLV